MGARVSALSVYPRSVRLSRGSSKFPHSVGHITSIYSTGTLPQDTSEDVHRCGQLSLKQGECFKGHACADHVCFS